MVSYERYGVYTCTYPEVNSFSYCLYVYYLIVCINTRSLKNYMTWRVPQLKKDSNLVIDQSGKKDRPWWRSGDLFYHSIVGNGSYFIGSPAAVNLRVRCHIDSGGAMSDSMNASLKATIISRAFRGIEVHLHPRSLT